MGEGIAGSVYEGIDSFRAYGCVIAVCLDLAQGASDLEVEGGDGGVGSCDVGREVLFGDVGGGDGFGFFTCCQLSCSTLWLGVGVPCAEKMAARMGFASFKVMDE